MTQSHSAEMSRRESRSNAVEHEPRRFFNSEGALVLHGTVGVDAFSSGEAGRLDVRPKHKRGRSIPRKSSRRGDGIDISAIDGSSANPGSWFNPIARVS